MGKTLIVENLGGASGSIGAQRLLHADPANLAMLVASPNELVLPPLALKEVRYTPEEFRMVAHLTQGALTILARPEFPANDLTELVELLRKPDTRPVSFGSTGIGSVFHLVGLDFAKKLGIPINHIPYRGGAPIMQDLMGSQIDLTFLPLIPSYIQSVQAGKIKVLGILAPKRNTAVPDVLSVDEVEALRGLHHSMWTGLFVSSKLPGPAADAIGKAANAIVGTPAFKSWVAERGNSAGDVMDLEQAAVFFARESARFERLAREIGLERE
ncbi:MAG TPA: tripartite tricarboxylate transporter substrate binding protein [Burkholderiaceae bacterium]|nr:tripartite tricarboxylate transporter substrate binding protein [Burkholderiaceae bacterium]